MSRTKVYRMRTVHAVAKIVVEAKIDRVLLPIHCHERVVHMEVAVLCQSTMLSRVDNLHISE